MNPSFNVSKFNYLQKTLAKIGIEVYMDQYEDHVEIKDGNSKWFGALSYAICVADTLPPGSGNNKLFGALHESCRI